ncbi:MAG: DUF4186 domain-containing protein [Clostridia bacterium]|nr:DUF4186 domain-containing protein [Clostridia bacterium]
METVDDILLKLNSSKFRSSFHLNKKDIDYINKKGIDTIRNHCADFVRQRLAPAVIPNDGRQTPMRGHPVFVAQHACACCCRGCFEKWYGVPRDVQLSGKQQEKAVELLMAWIEREFSESKPRNVI